MKAFRTIRLIMDRTLEVFSVAYVIGIIGVVLIQVFSRFFLPRTPQWTEELTRFLFIGTIGFAAGLGIRDKAFVNVDTVVDALPESARFALNILMKIVTVVLMAVIMRHSIPFILLGTRQVSSSLLIPMAIPFSMTLISSLFIIVYTLIEIVNVLSERIRSSRAQSGSEA